MVRLDGQIRDEGHSWEVSDPGRIRMGVVVWEARCNGQTGRGAFRSFMHSFNKHLYLRTGHGQGAGSNHVQITLFTYRFTHLCVCSFIYYTFLS